MGEIEGFLIREEGRPVREGVAAMPQVSGLFLGKHLIVRGPSTAFGVTRYMYLAHFCGSQQMRAMGFHNPTSDDPMWPTVEKAWERRLCIRCRCQAVPRCYSAAGVKEVDISGWCEPCFDEVTAGQ